FMILSTSRVYSINALCSIPLNEDNNRFIPDHSQTFPVGFSLQGVSENFSTSAPVSLYGSTKLASEIMALEYSSAFDFPVWVNRCGVIAGAGQFGKIDQGIFSFWIYQWMLGKPLSYIGFGGEGKQVRDFICPEDLARLISMQLSQPDKKAPKVVNVGGGQECSMSLKELSQYCAERLRVKREINSIPETRPFDIPYYVTDNSLVQEIWNWKPEVSATNTLDAIANWAKANRAAIEVGF
ncbi:NAD-dependent epimerase/dehydratase family protein, partial [Moorena sp. SIO3I6]|uniref:NAD-dependent epimerase/dehydratase family protein n=1 Tax=Moorena sp. SIO3I6 TaxID=2607831 RepID=UPI0013FB9FE1